MKASTFLGLAKSFASLSPTVSQVWNAVKYTRRFFGDSFQLKPDYDPISIGVYITYSCNLTCPYCWNKEINKKESMSKQITVEDFEGFLLHKRLQNAFRVSYVGGEPLTHPDLFRFIEIAWNKKKLSMFPSNGLLIEKNLDKFKDSKLHSIQISLYDGYVDEQIRNAELLRKANPKIAMSLARYVTTEQPSLDYMEEVIRMSKDLGLKNVCFQNFLAANKEDEYLAIYDNDEAVKEHFRMLEAKYGSSMNIMFPAPLTRKPENRFCYDLYTVAFVGKGGLLAPCSSIVPPSEKFGTLNDDGFWSNKYFCTHRKNFATNFPFNKTCEYCYEGSRHERSFI